MWRVCLCTVISAGMCFCLLRQQTAESLFASSVYSMPLIHVEALLFYLFFVNCEFHAPRHTFLREPAELIFNSKYNPCMRVKCNASVSFRDLSLPDTKKTFLTCEK